MAGVRRLAVRRGLSRREDCDASSSVPAHGVVALLAQAPLGVATNQRIGALAEEEVAEKARDHTARRAGTGPATGAAPDGSSDGAGRRPDDRALAGVYRHAFPIHARPHRFFRLGEAVVDVSLLGLGRDAAEGFVGV